MANKKTRADIELNPEFRRALAAMEADRHVFITGRAGTGKSTLLTYFRDRTKKKIVVLAPTGVAAVNVRGQTIHSFFGFKPDITVKSVKQITNKKDKKIYEKLDAIVIDEISMVRADLLDCVDAFLRKNGRWHDQPFGGIQMIFIGDLYQLPPVVTSAEKALFKKHYDSPYFFSSRVCEATQTSLLSNGSFSMEFIELEKVYRQRDQTFIELLNAVRNNTATDEHIACINERCDANDEPSGKTTLSICLTTTNAMASQENEKKLKCLPGKERVYQGKMQGHFERSSLPTDETLRLKKDAQVMLLNNDPAGRWINGTMAKIMGFESDAEIKTDTITVRLEDGTTHSITPYTWDQFEFSLDEMDGQVDARSVGSFTQYPLRLAWAVTIHKAQGKTFDHVVLDIGNGTFSPGQLYVGLSRCTRLEGLILKRPIKKQHIWMDWNVVKFVTKFQYQKSDEALPLQEKIAMIEKAIKHHAALAITYLKAQDIKSRRMIRPFAIGQREFKGVSFLGVEAYCEDRKADRMFRVDRILEMRPEDTNV